MDKAFALPRPPGDLLIIAAILAGGTSKRFSPNKLVYPLGGKPLVQHVFDNLRYCRKIIKTVAIASPYTAPLIEDLGVDTIIDNVCLGPMGAVYTALKMFREVLVVGGDMPSMCCDFIEKLTEVCRGYRYACIPRWRHGFMEPLAALYRYDILPYLEHGLQIGIYSIQRLIKTVSIEVEVVDIEENLSEFLAVFNNVNSLEDIAKLRNKTSRPGRCTHSL